MNWITAYRLVGIFVLALFSGCGGSPEEKAAKRGLHAFEMGEYASARKSLERALRDRSDLREDAPLYNILGMAYAKLGEVSAATNAYLRSQQLDTNDVVGIALNFFFPGAGYMVLGQTTKGIAILAATYLTCGAGYLLTILFVLDAYMVAVARKNRPVDDWEFFPK